MYDPDQCQLRLFTPAEARQCLGNRTLAFMGDSMIRDLSTAIGLFLQGMTIEDSLDIKFDHHGMNFLDGWIDWFPSHLEMWENPPCRGWIFPSTNRSHFMTNRTPDANHYDFQIQYWELYNSNRVYHSRGKKSNKSYLTDVLEGTVLDDPVVKKVGGRKMDYLFMNYGFHDFGGWLLENRDVVQLFYNSFHGQGYRGHLSHFHNPVIWVSLNSNCDFSFGNGVVGGHSANFQVRSVDRINREFGDLLKAGYWPYYDADMVLRSPDLCNVTGDGTYVLMI
jgi:hypothetical protein